MLYRCPECTTKSLKLEAINNPIEIVDKFASFGFLLLSSKPVVNKFKIQLNSLKQFFPGRLLLTCYTTLILPSYYVTIVPYHHITIVSYHYFLFTTNQKGIERDINWNEYVHFVT